MDRRHAGKALQPAVFHLLRRGYNLKFSAPCQVEFKLILMYPDVHELHDIVPKTSGVWQGGMNK